MKPKTKKWLIVTILAIIGLAGVYLYAVAPESEPILVLAAIFLAFALILASAWSPDVSKAIVYSSFLCRVNPATPPSQAVCLGFAQSPEYKVTGNKTYQVDGKEITIYEYLTYESLVRTDRKISTAEYEQLLAKHGSNEYYFDNEDDIRTIIRISFKIYKKDGFGSPRSAYSYEAYKAYPVPELPPDE